MLKSLLKKRGLRQSDFAKKLGVEAKYPSHFVTGRRAFPVSKVKLAAEVLGLDLKSQDFKEFQIGAWMTHCPSEVHDFIESLESKLLESEQKRLGLHEVLVESEQKRLSLEHILVELRQVAGGAGIKLPKTVKDL